jgi:hypothetical protein
VPPSEHNLHRVTVTGRIVPAIWLSFKADKLGGALSSADRHFRYKILNECVYEWDIVADTGSHVYHLKRLARRPRRLRPSGEARRRRYYSDQLNAYINPSITATTWNRIADAVSANTLKVHITLRLWFHKFFYEVLEWFSRDASDERNLADPGDPSNLYATYTQLSSRRFKFKIGTMKLKDVPCVLKDGPGLVPRGSRPPLKKIYCYMKVQESDASGGFTAENKMKIARCFAAADWSKLNRFGRSSTTARTRRALKIWYRNVGGYLRNYTDHTRGVRLFNALVVRGKERARTGGTQTAVVGLVRNEIDKMLITANHWSARREHPSLSDPTYGAIEKHQLRISKIFGAMGRRDSLGRPWAMPIGLYRDEVTARISLNYDERAAFILQMGLAHCGEHGDVSFAVLRKIMQADPAYKNLLKYVIRSGQANEDHAFLVGGVRPTAIIETKAGPRNKGYDEDDPITVWNLEAALTAAGVAGFICDPYLEQFRNRLTAQDLLNAIKRNLGPSSRPATKCVSWGTIYPALPPPPAGPATLTRPKGSVPGV